MAVYLWKHFPSRVPGKYQDCIVDFCSCIVLKPFSMNNNEASPRKPQRALLIDFLTLFSSTMHHILDTGPFRGQMIARSLMLITGKRQFVPPFKLGLGRGKRGTP